MILLLAACAPTGGPTFSPDSLDFGEVDFTGERPDEGYATATAVLTNEGEDEIAIALPVYDTDRLCIAGFSEDQDETLQLGTLPVDASYSFTIGICGHLGGEEDTVVETQLDVTTTAEDAPTVTLPITFTPIRTGR